jgi:hypothetical protein
MKRLAPSKSIYLYFSKSFIILQIGRLALYISHLKKRRYIDLYGAKSFIFVQLSLQYSMVNQELRHQYCLKGGFCRMATIPLRSRPLSNIGYLGILVDSVLFNIELLPCLTHSKVFSCRI